MNKKSLVIGGLVLVVLLLAGMLIYTTTANTNKINELQNQVSSEQEAREEEKAQVKERNDLLTLKNMEYRNNWDKYIRVEEDENYEKIGLGGIKNLQVTINNDTEYSVDEVVVKVYYILANGTPFETREFSLYNIPAKSFKTDPAPASKTNPQVNSVRGAKVMLEIVSISAAKFSFCYPYDNGNPKDPYKCK